MIVGDALEITCQLAGAGWADARVVHEAKVREMSLSYLSDAIGDMAWAAVNLLRGSRNVTFNFQDEPGEHCWMLERGVSDSLHICIRWFAETFHSGNALNGAEVFSCDCTVLDFVGEVSSVLTGLLEDADGEAYKRRWGHSFPIDAYNEIQRRLTTNDRVD